MLGKVPYINLKIYKIALYNLILKVFTLRLLKILSKRITTQNVAERFVRFCKIYIRDFVQHLRMIPWLVSARCREYGSRVRFSLVTSNWPVSTLFYVFMLLPVTNVLIKRSTDGERDREIKGS